MKTKEINGKDLLFTLIKLLSEQEGVEIKCKVIEGDEEDED